MLAGPLLVEERDGDALAVVGQAQTAVEPEFKTGDQLEDRVGGVALGDANPFAPQEAPVGAT